jgi:uncharacterized damage-inducible protein DinB
VSLATSLAADFQSEIDATRRVLGAVPESKFAWQPHKKSMTLGRLASHVAENAGFITGMMEPEMDFEVVSAQWKPLDAKSAKELLTAFEASVKTFNDQLAGKDDAFMKGTWTMRAGPKVFMSVPRHEAIRTIGLNHMIHHRGQLTVYLRLLDVPVPSTYGPTADHPMM